MTNNIFDLFSFADEKETKKMEAEQQAKALADKEAEVLAQAKKEVNDAANALNKELEKFVDENKKTTPKAKTTPEVVKFSPNEDTVIRFYGESLQISSYFSAEELAEGVLVKNKEESVRKPLTEELLRKRMEKDFPELVKDFVEIVYIPAKNLIIPMIKAKKKGNCIQVEVVSSDDIASPFSKIPYSILESFITLAKIYAKHDLEVHADVYYHSESKTYFLDVPTQTVHTYWVEVTEESYSIVNRVLDATKVLEIHSHHNMMALPSKQDNESERVPGMHYAIVGNVNRFYPDVYLRQFISEENGHSIKKVEELFETPFIQLPSFDSTSIEVSK